MPLTDVSVRKAVPAEKPYRLFDGRGLYLEVSPAGGRWWRFKYRFAQKEKRVSLGVYPDVGLKDARERRDQARKLLTNGIDPSENRKAQKAAQITGLANTFEAVAREWFAKYESSWVQKHSSRILRRLEADVFPWLKERSIADLTAPELLTVVRRIEKRGAIETAHRVLNICGQVFRYAIATGRASHNLAAGLRGALAPVKATHLAATTEPRKLGKLLLAMDGYKGSLPVTCALRLAPLVFVRPGELRHAEWANIDLEMGEWRFTASKTGAPHIVPLSKQATAVLRELKPLTGTGRFIFPSARSGDRPMSDNAVLAAMRRMGIEKEEMSGHGFRAVARTILDEVLGVRPDFIEHQLAHAVRDPNGRAYNRTAHLAERKKMMQDWADYLDGLKSECRKGPLA
jgi:integrase